jgi:hypothetical protein
VAPLDSPQLSVTVVLLMVGPGLLVVPGLRAEAVAAKNSCNKKNRNIIPNLILQKLDVILLSELFSK